MGNFAENFNLGKRVLKLPPTLVKYSDIQIMKDIAGRLW